jgi:nitrite reductase/ring-hydroxylating ferredoxin subunit
MSEVDIAGASEIVEGKTRALAHGKLSLVLTRFAGKLYAFENKCPHLGLPLAKGKLDGTTIRCPWHGARFDVASGENVQWCNAIPGGLSMPEWTHGMLALGKKPAPLHRFEAREANGRVYVTVP